MKNRIVSGVVIALAVVGLGIIGTYPLYMAVLLCSMIGYWELTAVFCPARPSRKKAHAPGEGVDSGEKAGRPGRALFPDPIALPGLFLVPVFYAGLMYIEWRYGLVNLPAMTAAADFWTVFLVAADFLLTMAVYVYTFPRRKSAQATGAVLSFLYAPVLMAFLCRTRNLRQGVFLYLLIFICSSVSDVCALAAGMAIGRHRLAPVLSPKKTVEGAVGGVAGSAAVSCILALALRFFDKGAPGALPFFAVIGVCGSIIGQTGDLAASAIKRNHGFKDYGDLIPGHGGIMDRFDSVLFTAPVIYYLSVFLMGRL